MAAPNILQHLLAVRGYVVVYDTLLHAIGDVIPVRVQSKQKLLNLLYLPVSSITTRRDYKAQNAILLEQFNKLLRDLPRRLHFYRVVRPGDTAETVSEKTVREWSAAVADIQRRKHGS
jgi:hypothetical protein